MTTLSRLSLLLLLAASAAVHALELEDEEGSGEDLTLLDQEDGEDDVFDEGSGGWDVSFGESPFSTDFEVAAGDKSKGTTEEDDYNDDYYYDNYDYLEEYMNKEDKYLEDYLDKAAEEGDSGMRFDDDANDIEIATRPTVNAEEEQIVLNTSQIFIMVGSSFISFAIFTLTFFLCRRMIVNKQRKAMAYPGTPEKLGPPCKEPPIVKDYQKVPTTTQEILRSTSPPRLNMYGGDADPENPAASPLVP